MKIIEIGYSVSKTLQIKQYEPINLFASIKAEVSPKEDLKKAFNELKEIVGQQIKKDIELMVEKRDGPVEPIRPTVGPDYRPISPMIEVRPGGEISEEDANFLKTLK